MPKLHIFLFGDPMLLAALHLSAKEVTGQLLEHWQHQDFVMSNFLHSAVYKVCLV